MNALTAPRPLPTRTHRRRLVITFAAGLTAVLLVSALSLSLPAQPTRGAAALLLMGLYGAGILCATVSGWQLARPAAQGLPQGHAEDLDERQRDRVAQAMATAYRILSLLIIALFLGFLWGGDGLLSRLKSTQTGPGIALSLLLLIPLLPSAVLAWTEPDADTTD